ncbi:MAG: MucB/RseB C-terminal domain-containing protein [Rhodocyclaceae bacterium]|nr:MucB/RseB C-terminal domain-containing protein [Rhodocyclaceae bacterium]
MRRTLLLAGLAACLALPCAARAELPVAEDALGWLGRMASAAQKQSYQGVFVYQHGRRSETSRIVHVVDGSGERERLEVLDGSPREVLRSNGEVKCLLPDLHMVILEKEDRRSFPATLPASPGSLADSYTLQKGGVVRVAGHESQLIVLEPKDELRYGRRLWADQATGLLLKASLVDEKNHTLEQFSFSEVQIGGNINRDALKSPFESQAAGWQVHDTRASQGVADGGGWQFKTLLPGFRQVAGMKRHLHEGDGDVLHLVFSDGMATVSVFVERVSAKRPQVPGYYTIGTTNVYKRIAGDMLLTALGEVPPLALRRLVDGMERN